MITDLITNTGMTEELRLKWNSVIDMLKVDENNQVRKVEANMGYKYRGDLYGLFLEIGIERNLIYPHMKINGYDNSDEYRGDKTEFIFLDSSTAMEYLSIFKL